MIALNWPKLHRSTRLPLAVLLACALSNFAVAQPQYPSTGGYPSTTGPRYQQRPAPVANYPSTEGARANQPYNNQPYNEPYGRAYHETQRGYPTTESLGPYNDYQQRNELLPNFEQDRRVGRQPAPPQREPFQPAKQIAIVRTDSILAGDLLGEINQMLAPYQGKATEEQLEEQRQLLMQKLLPQTIQTKILYQELVATLPPEALPQIQNKLANEFDEKQLPVLMERAKVNSPAELDAELRKFGTSIDKQRRQFSEQVLAREVVRQNVETEPAVSHQEMLQYYQQNAADYERPARVRWEELAVRIDEFPSKAEAYRAIANMGNRVLRGAAFSRVAREQSQGFTADNGGWHDWTLKNSLKAKDIERAIYEMPAGQLSNIIESDWGFHIVRVLDREDAGRVPFFQEQVRIKAKLQKEKRDSQVEEYVAKLKARTRVWTIYDDGEG